MQNFPLADGGHILLLQNFLTPTQSATCFNTLLTQTAWQQKPARFGHPQPRLTATHGDPGITYHYSGTTNPASPWTQTLLQLKDRIQSVDGVYNFCLLNRYRSGADSIAWHADNEPGMADTIASLSLGATRTFRIRHNITRQTLSFQLTDGTLLIMGGTTQRFWKHAVPKTAQLINERINLTFRWLEK